MSLPVKIFKRCNHCLFLLCSLNLVHMERTLFLGQGAENLSTQLCLYFNTVFHYKINYKSKLLYNSPNYL